MAANDILIVGYPRSGNTWISRLLGDALNSPVTGYLGAHPLGEEGLDRPGPFVVRQLHLRIAKKDMGKFMPSAYRVCLKHYSSERIVLIVRDPRDVALSIMHYWQRKSLDDALQAMIFGDNPVRVHGPLGDFYAEWHAADLPYALVRYEDLLSNTEAMMRKLCHRLSVVPEHKISRVVRRQSFKNRKATITDDLPYGKGIQNTHLWKGRAGHWPEYFNRRQAQLVELHLGTHLRRYGYEKDSSWMKGLPEE